MIKKICCKQIFAFAFKTKRLIIFYKRLMQNHICHNEMLLPKPDE